MGRELLFQCKVRGVPISPYVLLSPLLSLATYQQSAHAIQNTLTHVWVLWMKDWFHLKRGFSGPEMTLYHEIWNNIAFHHFHLEWKVCSTALFDNAILLYITSSEPSGEILLCLEMEGLQFPDICVEGSDLEMPGNRWRGLSGMDTLMNTRNM